jgi:PST family polysaccharide transporter
MAAATAAAPILSSRRRLIGNVSALYMLQGARYAIPFVTFPYLTRVLGPTRFGLVLFAQSLAQYFVVLTDYGFNLSATHEVSIRREDRHHLSEIFGAVMVIKVAFLALSLVIIAALTTLVPRFRAEWPVYIVALLPVVGYVLFPQWLFQGLERMKSIAVLIIVGQSLGAACIFIFVRRPGDYTLALAFLGIGPALAGVAGLVPVLKSQLIRLQAPSPAGVIKVLRDGWPIFISTAAISLYLNTNIFVLGLLRGDEEAGYFGAATKLIAAVSLLFAPIFTAVYPHAHVLMHRSRGAGMRFIRKLLAFTSVPAFIFSLALLLFAPLATRVAFGFGFGETGRLIRIMAFIPLFVTVSNTLGNQCMLALGMNRAFSRTYVRTGVTNLLLVIPLVLLLQARGAALALAIAEAQVMMLLALNLKKEKLGMLYPVRVDVSDRASHLIQ